MSADAAPYEALADLAERELELAGEGRLDDLVELAAQRAAIVARLSPNPPAAARSALLRAALTQERVTIELMRGRDELLAAIATLSTAQRVARGYASGHERRPQIDASA